tara:strand:+ start:2500 stop:3144 length:645 start_codon:yes stop_codon:yes gene_type:complete
MKKGLEKVIRDKVKPIIDLATIKTLGISSPEIQLDITDHILRSPLVHLPVDTTTSYKQAKKAFKEFYIQKLLHLHFGNVSQVAKIAGIDRRSIHRLVQKFKINVPKMRKEMLRAEYIKESKVSGIIEDTLESYKASFHPEKIKELYAYLPRLSKDIVKELPDEQVSLKEAEDAFDKQYFKAVLDQNNGNIAKTARQIKIRYETLHRKLRKLGLI